MAFRKIFDRISAPDDKVKYDATVSMLGNHNENLHDSFMHPSKIQPGRFKVREDKSEVILIN